MRRTTAATRPDEIRRHNLSVMLAHVHRDGALTRAQLTQRLAVSRSTVGALVADLTELGLVQEVVPSGGVGVGRPSHVIGPPEHGPFAVAVDIDVTHLTLAAVGLGGRILVRKTLPVRRGCSPADVARALAGAIPKLRAARPVGVGVSVPGTVARDNARVGVAPNLGWHDVEFGRLLGDVLHGGVPVAIGNDADLAVLAEHERGSGRGCDDVVFLMGRVGVGAGIIVDGAPLRGYDGHAGEIGHNVVDPAGPPCHCGKNGCLETYVGDGAMLALAGRDGEPTEAALAAMFAAARSGEAAAVAALDLVAESLGRAIASLVNTLNTQRVLLGGSLSQLLSIAGDRIEESVQRYVLESHGHGIQLVQPALGADAALLGAAELAFAPLLNDPLGATAALAG